MVRKPSALSSGLPFSAVSAARRQSSSVADANAAAKDVAADEGAEKLVSSVMRVSG